MSEPADLDALERECATAAHVCNRTTSVLELIAELRAAKAAIARVEAKTNGLLSIYPRNSIAGEIAMEYRAALRLRSSR